MYELTISIGELYDICKQNNVAINDLNIEVETRHGYKKIEAIDITAYNSPVMEVQTKSTFIKVSPDHLLFTNKWMKTKELMVDDNILTKDGYQPIESIITLDDTDDLYDIQVADVKEYYANDIVSHNSTILSALCFVLFGKNSDMRSDSKSSLSTVELINDINKKELLVELFLENGMMIRRGLKPDVFEIIDKDGMNLADKSSKLIDQQFLEQEILEGMSFSMFHKLTYISSKSISTPFLYMTPSQRKEFLEHVLDIRLVYYVGEVIKTKIATMKLDIKTTEMKMEQARNSVTLEERSIENLLEQRKQAQESYDSLIANRQQLIDAQKMQLEQQLDIKEKFNKIIAKLDEDKIEESNRLQIIISQLSTVQTHNEQIRVLSSQINELQTLMMRLKNEKDIYDKNKAGFVECGTCPTLNKIVGVFDVEKYITTIQEYKTQYQNILNEIEEHKKQVEGTSTLQVEKEQIDKKIFELSQQSFQAKSYYDTAVNAINSAYSVIAELEADIKPLNLAEVSYESLNQFKEALTSIELTYDKLKNGQEQLERIKKRVGDKTIHKQIMEQYIPIFQNKVNELLAKFMEDDPFSFSLELDAEFNMIGKKNGKESNIFKLSEGQKTSIHFAVLFAMQYVIGLKNGNTSGVLMIDEILDLSLDSDRVTKVLEYLHDMSNERLIILISHNDDISAEYFNKIINVTKVYNFSSYEVQ